MANLFEQLMSENRQVSTSAKPGRTVKPVRESVKKISSKKIKVESLKILEDANNLDELETQFAVDPEESAEDEVVLVIDPEISDDEEVPENAAEEMIGDTIYKCPVCGGNYVCDCDATQNENLEVDEDGVPTECPICGDDADQILIGEIAPAEGAGEETELDPVDSEDAEESEEEEEVPEDGIIEEESLKREDFDESELEEDEVVVDIEDVPEASEVPAELELNVEESEEEEEVPPVVEIDAEVVNLSIDDTRLESMMNKMIRENYKNNPSFKLTRVASNGKSLKLEYVVRTKGCKPIKGLMVAEGFDAKSRKMSLAVKDRGAFTESFSKRPAFVVECVRIGSKVIPVSLQYNFTKKINESVYRVKGSCK